MELLIAIQVAYLRTLPKGCVEQDDGFQEWLDSLTPDQVHKAKVSARQWLRRPAIDGTRPLQPKGAVLPFGRHHASAGWDKAQVIRAILACQGSGNRTVGRARRRRRKGGK